jgi:predicted unusual protein kinase regulating ubiquinone biosynthesis (AarF/ABC1/UbiB family)
MKNKETNETIILKLKRKNIEKKMDHAIQQVRTLLYLFNFLPLFQILNIKKTVEKNLQLIIQQMDFQQEVKNTIEMKKSCKHLSIFS